jgi:hypothetical protein
VLQSRAQHKLVTSCFHGNCMVECWEHSCCWVRLSSCFKIAGQPMHSSGSIRIAAACAWCHAENASCCRLCQCQQLLAAAHMQAVHFHMILCMAAFVHCTSTSVLSVLGSGAGHTHSYTQPQPMSKMPACQYRSLSFHYAGKYHENRAMQHSFNL